MSSELELLKMELEAILETSNDNIMVVDGKGIILRASSNCQTIYGLEQDELIGQSVYQLEYKGIFRPSVTAKVLRDRKEVQLMQRTPTNKTVMATGIPVFDKHKNIIRVITFSHDLTEIHSLKADYEQLQRKMAEYETEIEELREKEARKNEVVIKSKSMREIDELVHRVAQSDATVVLLGESGVGKNVFARAIHHRSERKKERFVEVNCGAIPETLFESELFGYEPGSFTGASKNGKAGMIELADKGTLFLDEIAELPLEFQVKLLKVIQEKEVARIGSSRAKQVDFRLIAATNQDLEKMVKEGKFRKDLYYRLNVIPITIPPLRERKEEIYDLAQHYLSIFNEKYRKNKMFHSTVIHAFMEYDWPGNVRELENLVERLVVTLDGNVIFPSHLPFVHGIEQLEPGKNLLQLEAFEQRGMTLKEIIQEVEKNWLERAYRQCKTTYEMAEYLGISQATVVRRLQKYNINSK